MKIIVVAGAHSGIGKTTLVESILRRLKNWSALKVTVIKTGPCPRLISCGVCETQRLPYSITSRGREIYREGKDTQRMKAAGAKKVIWLKARPSALREGLEEALGRFRGSEGVVVEGTSVLKYVQPDIRIFITAKGKINIDRPRHSY